MVMVMVMVMVMMTTYPHTIADSVSTLIIKVLLAYSKDESYNIETINYPLPLNSKQKNQNFAYDITSFFLALLLALQLLFLLSVLFSMIPIMKM